MITFQTKKIVNDSPKIVHCNDSTSYTISVSQIGWLFIDPIVNTTRIYPNNNFG